LKVGASNGVRAAPVAGIVPKAHLPNTGEFYEQRWFASGRVWTGGDWRMSSDASAAGWLREQDGVEMA
jgi:predicted amidohydrolase